MRWAVALLYVCACGRVNFDPLGEGVLGDGGTAGSGDGGGPSDGGAGSGVDAPPIAGDTCTTARAINIGDVLQNESLIGAADDHSVICSGGIDVVYRFTQPVTGTRQVDVLADFDGIAWVNTGGNGCPPVTGGCQQFSADVQYSGTPTVGAGTRDIMIEKTGGAGTSFVIGLQ